MHREGNTVGFTPSEIEWVVGRGLVAAEPFKDVVRGVVAARLELATRHLPPEARPKATAEHAVGKGITFLYFERQFRPVAAIERDLGINDDGTESPVITLGMSEEEVAALRDEAAEGLAAISHRLEPGQSDSDVAIGGIIASEVSEGAYDFGIGTGSALEVPTEARDAQRAQLLNGIIQAIDAPHGAGA